MVDPAQLAPLPVDVVSVQSQVCYGCVGNCVAVPTLQALGLNVVPVPTVYLSTVPQYDTLSGGAIPQEWFEGFLADIGRRGVLRHARAVLVGYLGSPAQARALADWLRDAIADKPELLVLLDPVMGDHDSGLYVHPELPAALTGLTGLATGLTPNAFELERLAGRALGTLEETVAAARALLGGRTRWVVVTSAAPSEAGQDETRIAIVTQGEHAVVRHRRVASAAKGTGDLFSAALLAGLLRGGDLPGAVRAAQERVVTVLERTERLGCAELVLNEV
ncbi:MAG: pyridoxine/pyridoxal/pyridoxamine kinase [Trueperaceae bacterium]|nr:pyridoxine/pyridoxal/pyridoxamine kinase [Trueperaceae bacterium]MCW5820431.1 pyridoxine/pyridoxal/pyridoxamine kinase [Trueperaceae bacterium]